MLKKIYRSLNSIYYRFKLLSKIKKLDVLNCKIDDKITSVTLRNGLTFSGFPSKPNLNKYYSLLKKDIKTKVPFYATQVVYDIIIRFIEGGLKLGGPAKEKFYKVKEGDIIAEMGAYMGFYTIYLSQKAGKKGKVIAIEPIDSNLNFLKKNISQNNLTNVSIVEKGVWKEKTLLTFFKKTKDNQSSSIMLEDKSKDQFSIEVDSLDNILANENVTHVDFMIIQLNGAEYEALLGLNKIKPKNIAIAARYSKKGTDVPAKIKSLLIKRGYEVNVVQRKYVYAKLLNENESN